MPKEAELEVFVLFGDGGRDGLQSDFGNLFGEKLDLVSSRYLGSGTKDQGPRIRDQRRGIREQGTGIRVQGRENCQLKTVNCELKTETGN